MNERELRGTLVETARRLLDLGLTQGTSGNVSVRLGDGLLITPTAVPFETLRPDDLAVLDLDGAVRRAPGGRAPSTEWRLHAAILRERNDLGAVVHAHPPWATALACLRRGIPPFHYMVAAAGGREIRCADYATFGSVELAEAAVDAMRDCRACLLANHGIVACGASLEAALRLAVEVETLAGQYLRALAVGEPTLLSEAEMDAVLESFADYGRGDG